jgi:hypothetical protein
VGQPIGPILKGQDIQKREQSMAEVNGQSSFFFGGGGGGFSIVQFFKKAQFFFWKPALFTFSGQEAPDLVYSKIAMLWMGLLKILEE